MEHKSLNFSKPQLMLGLSPHFPGISPWLPDISAFWCLRLTHSFIPHYHLAAAAFSYTHLPRGLSLGKVGYWYAECHESVVGNLGG